MNYIPAKLESAIMDTALAPWPQARFLMTIGLVACLPRTEEDICVEVLSSPGLASAIVMESLTAPVTIDTADGAVVIDPDVQMPFLELVALIDRLSRHEIDDDRISGVKALVNCALCTPDWAGFG